MWGAPESGPKGSQACSQGGVGGDELVGGAPQLGCGLLGVGGCGDPRAKEQEEGEERIRQIGRRGERNKENRRLGCGVETHTAQDAGLKSRAASGSTSFERGLLHPCFFSLSCLGESC